MGQLAIWTMREFQNLCRMYQRLKSKLLHTCSIIAPPISPIVILWYWNVISLYGSKSSLVRKLSGSRMISLVVQPASFQDSTFIITASHNIACISATTLSGSIKEPQYKLCWICRFFWVNCYWLIPGVQPPHIMNAGFKPPPQLIRESESWYYNNPKTSLLSLFSHSRFRIVNPSALNQPHLPWHPNSSLPSYFSPA
jgi:hypothetical protein